MLTIQGKHRGVTVVSTYKLLTDDLTKAYAMIDNQMRKRDYLPREVYSRWMELNPVLDFAVTFPTIKEMSEEKMTQIINDTKGYTQEDFAPETVVETPVKAKRAKVEKSPLFELLPQVFKGNGKVKKHPTNAKVKTSGIRDVIREAARLSMMTSVMLVIPAGVICLSSDFKRACVNSKGDSTYDLVLEEMLMNGWTMRGVQMTSHEFAEPQAE